MFLWTLLMFTIHYLDSPGVGLQPGFLQVNDPTPASEAEVLLEPSWVGGCFFVKSEKSGPLGMTSWWVFSGLRLRDDETNWRMSDYREGSKKHQRWGMNISASVPAFNLLHWKNAQSTFGFWPHPAELHIFHGDQSSMVNSPNFKRLSWRVSKLILVNSQAETSFFVLYLSCGCTMSPNMFEVSYRTAWLRHVKFQCLVNTPQTISLLVI